MNLKNFGIIEGRLVKDVELRTNDAGQQFCFLRVAVNRNFKNQTTGEYDSDFIDVTAFGKTAEFISKYFVKGNPIQLQVCLRSSTKEVEIDGNKVNRTILNVVVESVEFPITNKGTDTNKGNGAQAPTTDDFASIADDDDLPF